MQEEQSAINAVPRLQPAAVADLIEAAEIITVVDLVIMAVEITTVVADRVIMEEGKGEMIEKMAVMLRFLQRLRYLLMELRLLETTLQPLMLMVGEMVMVGRRSRRRLAMAGPVHTRPAMVHPRHRAPIMPQLAVGVRPVAMMEDMVGDRWEVRLAMVVGMVGALLSRRWLK